ncbi:unnamed protein product [Lota lota]
MLEVQYSLENNYLFCGSGVLLHAMRKPGTKGRWGKRREATGSDGVNTSPFSSEWAAARTARTARTVIAEPLLRHPETPHASVGFVRLEDLLGSTGRGAPGPRGLEPESLQGASEDVFILVF